MRILKISDAWSWTAEADNLVRMTRELGKRGHAIAVACTPSTPLARKLVEAGLDARPLPGLRTKANPLSLWTSATTLGNLIGAFKPEVVHAYRSPPHVLSAWALRKRDGISLVRTRGNMDAPRGHFLNRRLYDQATHATIVTAEAVRVLLVGAGFDADRIHTVHGALELERFDPSAHDRGDARERLGVPRDAHVVGHLARLAPVKGHSFLLDAMPEVLRRVPDAWLVLVGPAWPGMDEKVRVMAAKAGVAHRVRFAGKVDDAAAAIAAFDVGVVASIGSEAMSRAALEYLAMGVPVVATRVGSLPELVADGRTGLLVPPRDAGALGGAIAALLADPARRAAFGAAARADALDRFGAEAQASKLEGIYRMLRGSRNR